MSRIGKLPIHVPAGVTVTIKDNVVTVKGPKGELVQEVNPVIARSTTLITDERSITHREGTSDRRLCKETTTDGSVSKSRFHDRRSTKSFYCTRVKLRIC